ncbi:MAG: hypothetical protein M3041_05320 [Acidobacteriota bacterium]|nr:hypothetical protein [Acidobacteriota bacterium]
MVDEAGEAIEAEGVFRTRALGEDVGLQAPDTAAVEEAAREIESIVAPPMSIERLLVSEGIVRHQLGDRTWSDTARRVHISVAHGPLRAIFDFAEFRFDTLRSGVAALARAGKERKPPKRIRLAEHVGAALLGFAPVAKLQSAAAHDGKGDAIIEQPAVHEPPNWFRPSYRIRPRRAWFHLRVVPFGVVENDLPEAVALLAPVSPRELRVLCVERRAVYPTTIPLRPINAAKPTATWYPYGAGAFGAELIL